VSEFSERDRQFMSRALEQASRAARLGEVPVGAVVVMGNEVVAEACNQQITLSDPSAHAELLALRTAAATVGNYRLPGCELFVTLEPCTMCCGVKPKAGAVISAASALDNDALNHRVLWSEGLYADESAAQLKAFFKARRSLKA